MGLDLAWWGGGSRDDGSCWDTIVGNEPGTFDPWHRPVDLRCVPNPAAADDPCVPNRDSDAGVLLDALEEELRRVESAGASRVVLAIDAPLATVQAGLPPRPRAAKRGEPVGFRRSCDSLLAATQQKVGGPWSQTIHVQPGAPLFPRVARLVERLANEHRFALWDGATPYEELPNRVLVEVFPASAIWALGVTGCYGHDAPDSVGLYKRVGGRCVTLADAKEWAERPLRGFIPVLDEIADLRPAIRELATRACKGAPADTGTSGLDITKRYDDFIDSSIAWLSAVAFVHGRAHVFTCSDRDGHILGPGVQPQPASLPREVAPQRPRVRATAAASAERQWHCPLCGQSFEGSSSHPKGWDAHVRSAKKHPEWHPEVSDRAARQALFEEEFPHGFTPSPTADLG